MEQTGATTVRRPCERALVEDAARGDRAAYAELHGRYWPAVRTLIRAELHRARWVEVDDVAQDVFISAWLGLDSLRDPERFRPWLLQIARRAVIDHGRREARRPALTHDDDRVLDQVLAVDANPLDHVVGRELGHEVRIAVDDLSSRDATVLTLAVQFGFGPREIAEAIGVTPATAKVALHRARSRLRSRLRGAA